MRRNSTVQHLITVITVRHLAMNGRRGGELSPDSDCAPRRIMSYLFCQTGSWNGELKSLCRKKRKFGLCRGKKESWRQIVYVYKPIWVRSRICDKQDVPGKIRRPNVVLFLNYIMAVINVVVVESKMISERGLKYRLKKRQISRL